MCRCACLIALTQINDRVRSGCDKSKQIVTPAMTIRLIDNTAQLAHKENTDKVKLQTVGSMTEAHGTCLVFEWKETQIAQLCT